MTTNNQQPVQTGTTGQQIGTNSSSQAQAGSNQPQSNQMEDVIKHLKESGYKVTEEYGATGRSRVSAESPQRKTWWDWGQLLIIPLLIALLGIGFTWVQNETSLQIAKDSRVQDLQIARDTQEEATLKTYLDDMSDLLLNRNLRKSKPGDGVRLLASERTLTVLRRLDGKRNDIVLQFLQDAKLIGSKNAVISLNNANLSGDDLSGANLGGVSLINTDLSEANLSGADLLRANLSGAKLIKADLSYVNPFSTNNSLGSNGDVTDVYDLDLSGADLSGANLSHADLIGANLDGINLNGADLSYADLQNAELSTATFNNYITNLNGANLSYVNLRNAKVTQEQLAQAKSLKGATMPDGSIHP